MDLVSRLKQYLDSRQISVTQFADECGIPRPTASQLLAGRNKKVSDEIIGKIHQCYPELNVIWLMFGEGNMVTATNIEISEPQNKDFSEFRSADRTGNQQDISTPTGGQNFPENPYEKIEPHFQENKPGSFPSRQSYPTQQPKQEQPVKPAGEFRFSSPAKDTTSTFAFSNPTQGEPSPTPAPRQPESTVTFRSDPAPRPITLTPGKGKRVTGIVVYYDDSTYESFIPDPDHSTPFLKKDL